MIYVSNAASIKEKADVVISKGSSGMTIQYVKARPVVSVELAASSVSSKPEILHLGYSPTKGIYTYTGGDCRESRSGLSFAIESNGARYEGAVPQIASVWIAEDAVDEWVVYFNGCVSVFTEGFAKDEVTRCGGYRSFNDVLRAFVPESAGYLRRAEAKRKLVRGVNELDSLAMLEGQLDLLTRFVLTGEGRDALEAAVDDVMVMSVHDDAKLTQTIQRQKAHLRELQKIYFQEKGGFDRGDLSA